MVDITQASDSEISRSVDAFTAAIRAKPVTLPNVRIERILLAVDESNQGRTAERFAQSVADAHRARVVLLYAYEGLRDDARERYLTDRARALEAAGITLEPMEEPVRTEHGLRSFEQILRTAESKGCDLIVVPAPYLDDFSKLGAESVGTNLDVLMSRSRVPLLVVRAPDVDPRTCLPSALLPVTPYTPNIDAAAAWTLKLVGASGSIRLLGLTADARAGGSEARLQGFDLRDVDSEKLAGLRAPALAGLIGELQRRTIDAGITCRLIVRGGDAIEVTREMSNAETGVLVLTSSDEALMHARTLALVRCSRNPVLVVTTDGQGR